MSSVTLSCGTRWPMILTAVMNQWTVSLEWNGGMEYFRKEETKTKGHFSIPFHHSIPVEQSTDS